MPFLPTSFLDEEQKKANALNVSGPSGTVANTAAQNASAPKPVKDSGSWTNLNSYLDANKDNAVQMGSTIAGNIANQGTKTQGLIDSSKNDFTAKADVGTIANLASAKDDAKAITAKARSGTANAQVGDDEVGRFKEVSNAEYKGPGDLTASDYYSDTLSNLNKSNEYRANAQTDEGRFNLLQEFFARPTYSQGQKSLDNLLIQGNETARNDIAAKANNLTGLQGNFDNAVQYATDEASRRVKDSNDARTFARGYLTDNRSARTSEVDADLAGIQSQWSNEYDNYNNLLSAYDGGNLVLTNDQANKLGLTKGTGQGIYNLLKGTPAANYLDLDAYDANKVVSADQFAQLAALDQLAKTFGANATSKFTDPSLAGTSSLDNNFRANRFGQAADAADTAFGQYARDTNISGVGYGKDAYKTNWGLENKYTNASTSIDANLADFLNSGAYSVDGSFFRPPPGNVLEQIDEIRQIPLDALSQVFGGDESIADSANVAKNKANAAAQANFMSQLNEILGNEGYTNRVLINDIPKRNSMLK